MMSSARGDITAVCDGMPEMRQQTQLDIQLSAVLQCWRPPSVSLF